MTLIVSRIMQDGHLETVSDTRISETLSFKKNLKDHHQYKPLSALLKTLIIHPKISISYAGTFSHMESVRKTIKQHNNPEKSSIIDILYKAHCNSYDELGEDNAIDFILSTTTNDNKVDLIRIWKKRIEENLQNAWIGDYEAFNYFQNIYQQSNNHNSLYDAMQAVIENNSIESTGGFPIISSTNKKICPNNTVFIYKTHSTMHSGHKTLIIKSEEEIKIDFGSAKDGSYDLSFLRSEEPYHNAVGIFCHSGKFGILLSANISLHGFIFFPDNCEDFLDKVKNSFGLELKGLYRKNNSSIAFI